MAKNIFKSIAAVSIIMALVLMTTSGCATNRKCNGRKGIRTPMGLM